MVRDTPKTTALVAPPARRTASSPPASTSRWCPKGDETIRFQISADHTAARHRLRARNTVYFQSKSFQLGDGGGASATACRISPLAPSGAPARTARNGRWRVRQGARPTLISGGHKGAEAEFGRAAKRWGVEQTTLSFVGHDMEWPVSVRVLSDARARPGRRLDGDRLQADGTHLPRGRADPPRRAVALRTWSTTAYQVFAIGWIQPDDTVKGGTGWGVELAKLFNRPVWVFDQARGEWFAWRDGHWVPEDPTLGDRAFAGTGTRNLSEAGRAAIADLFRRSARRAPRLAALLPRCGVNAAA